MRAVATAYVKAVNSVDEAAATRLTCKKTGPGGLYKVATAGGAPEKYSSDVDPVPLLFRNPNGWCVSV